MLDNENEIQFKSPESDIVPLQLRAFNHIIDHIIMVIATSILGPFLMGDLFSSGRTYSPQSFALGIAISILYYILTEGATGQSIGKKVTKTKVVDEFGQHPSPVKILLRTLIRSVPFEEFSFFFYGEPRGWHDRWTKTYVVPEDF